MIFIIFLFGKMVKFVIIFVWFLIFNWERINSELLRYKKEIYIKVFLIKIIFNVRIKVFFL